MKGLVGVPLGAIAVLMSPMAFAQAGPSLCEEGSNVQLIQTLVGNNGGGYNGEGNLASQTGIGGPYGGLAMDSLQRLHFTDFGTERVRRVETDGTVNTVLGNGSSGFSADGTPALAASLNKVFGIAFDSADTLHFVDGYNHRVRKIDAATQTLVTVAGGGTLSPANGDGGPATAVYLQYPAGIAFDSHGDLYFADRHHYSVRKVDSAGTIRTVVGNALNSNSFIPGQLAANTAIGEINYLPLRLAYASTVHKAQGLSFDTVLA